MNSSLKYHIFVGYDSREPEAFDVCKYSLEQNPQAIVHKIDHKEMRTQGLFRRPWLIDPTGQHIDITDGKPFSTEFSHTRFLVPELARREKIKSNWVLFCDTDFLFLKDVKDLFALTDDKYAAMCVKFNFTPKPDAVKMDGRIQAPYHRKLWSSLVLWNINHPSNIKDLTVEKVNTEKGSYLHAFEWLNNKDIGGIHEQWNFIPGISYNDPYVRGDNRWPKAVHFSEGGPWFKDYSDVLFSDEWREMYSRSLRSKAERMRYNNER